MPADFATALGHFVGRYIVEHPVSLLSLPLAAVGCWLHYRAQHPARH